MQIFDVLPLNRALIKRHQIKCCTEANLKAIYRLMLSYENIAKWLADRRSAEHKKALVKLFSAGDAARQDFQDKQHQQQQRDQVLAFLNSDQAWPKRNQRLSGLADVWQQHSQFSHLTTPELFALIAEVLDPLHQFAVDGQAEVFAAQECSKAAYFAELGQYFIELQKRMIAERHQVAKHLLARLAIGCEAGNLCYDDMLADMLAQRVKLGAPGADQPSWTGVAGMTEGLFSAAYRFIFRYADDKTLRAAARLPWYPGRLWMSRQGKLYALPELFEQKEIPTSAPAWAWFFRGRTLRYLFFRDGLKQVKLGLAVRSALKPLTSKRLPALLAAMHSGYHACEALLAEHKRSQRAALVLWPWIHNQTRHFLQRWEEHLDQQFLQVTTHIQAVLQRFSETPSLPAQLLVEPALLQSLVEQFASMHQLLSKVAGSNVEAIQAQIASIQAVLTQQCLQHFCDSLCATTVSAAVARHQWQRVFAARGAEHEAWQCLLGKPTLQSLRRIAELWQAPSIIKASLWKKQIMALEKQTQLPENTLWHAMLGQVMMRHYVHDDPLDDKFISGARADIQRLANKPLPQALDDAFELVVNCVQSIGHDTLRCEPDILNNALGLIQSAGLSAINHRLDLHEQLITNVHKVQAWDDVYMDKIVLACGNKMVLQDYGLRKLSIAIAKQQLNVVMQCPFFQQVGDLEPSLRTVFAGPVEQACCDELDALLGDNADLETVQAWYRQIKNATSSFPISEAGQAALAKLFQAAFDQPVWSAPMQWLMDRFATVDEQRRYCLFGLRTCLRPEFGAQVDCIEQLQMRLQLGEPGGLGVLGFSQPEQAAVVECLTAQLKAATESSTVYMAQFTLFKALFEDAAFAQCYQLQFLKITFARYREHAQLLAGWSQALRKITVLSESAPPGELLLPIQSLLETLRRHAGQPRYQRLVLEYQAKLSSLLHEMVISRIQAKFDSASLCELVLQLQDALLDKLACQGMPAVKSTVDELQTLVTNRRFLSTAAPRLLQRLNRYTGSAADLACINPFTVALLKYGLVSDVYQPLLKAAFVSVLATAKTHHPVWQGCLDLVDKGEISAALSEHMVWVGQHFESGGDPLSPVPNANQVSASMKQCLYAFYQVEGKAASEKSVASQADCLMPPTHWLLERADKALRDWIAALRDPDAAKKHRQSVFELLPKLQAVKGQDSMLDPKIEALVETAKGLDRSLVDVAVSTDVDIPKSTPLVTC